MSKKEGGSNPLVAFLRQCKEEIPQKMNAFVLPPKREIMSLYEQYVDWLAGRRQGGTIRRERLRREVRATAASDFSKAFRYVSFTLADHANHRKAKESAYWNNYFRTRELGERKQRPRWLLNGLYGITTGYLERPRRFVATIVVIWAAFALLYGVISWSPNDYTSIAFTTVRPTNPTIRPYHYAYFSAVTMTTLGYGDLAPNHSDVYWIRNLLTLLLCSSEAIIGYAILGLAVAMTWRFILPHPHAKIDIWIAEYERSIGLSNTQSHGRK